MPRWGAPEPAVPVAPVVVLSGVDDGAPSRARGRAVIPATAAPATASRPAATQNAPVARALAGHDELAFVAATTGPTNLVAQALCPDPAALHDYLTRRLGSLEAIRAVESAPVLRTIKAAGPLRPTAPTARGASPNRRATR